MCLKERKKKKKKIKTHVYIVHLTSNSFTVDKVVVEVVIDSPFLSLTHTHTHTQKKKLKKLHK